MHINLATKNELDITHYDSRSVTIGGHRHERSFILTHEQLYTTAKLPKSASEMSIDDIKDHLECDLVIIAHNEKGLVENSNLRFSLYQQNIGLEIMPLGSACRTWNVLMSEDRPTTGVFIF